MYDQLFQVDMDRMTLFARRPDHKAGVAFSAGRTWAENHIIMDSVGVGYGKDADEFGDMGSNTLGSIIRENPRLKIDNLKSMGILNL